MASGTPSTIAEVLKAEGNAFHQSQKYQEAYAKYSEAIKHDPKNAILWANRAASALSMQKYLDAATDAQKATQIDPKYTKAWGRQGTALLALGSWEQSKSAFKKALECLPATGDMSKADHVLKTQFEDGLKKAEASLKYKFKPEVCLEDGSPEMNNLPWKKAMAMEQELIAQNNYKTSAWVILSAYREFKEGLDGMNEQQIKVINGQQSLMGKTGIIAVLSNAILRDRRAFHMDNTFLDKYNKQMMLEIQQTNAWTKGGPKMIQDEAPKRLKTLGWGAVRPALAVTVRAWIMRGFLQASFQVPGASAEFFSDALQILEWGARVWKNVPKAERGAIFEASFIRGVKRLYLNLLAESYMGKGEDPQALENVANLAREILDERLPVSKEEVDPGFVSSFWIYPEADAHVMLGWYYFRKALATSDYNEGTELYKESAEHYLKGATTYPQDDEKHVMFLKICLEAHWFAGSPLLVTLPIAKRVRDSIPVMMKIWEYSSDAKSRNQSMEMVLSFEEHFIAEILAGRMTLEQSGAPDGMERPRP